MGGWLLRWGEWLEYVGVWLGDLAFLLDRFQCRVAVLTQAMIGHMTLTIRRLCNERFEASDQPDRKNNPNLGDDNLH